MYQKILLTLLSNALVVVPLFNSYAVEGAVVKIGVIAPLTGNAAHVGAEIQRTIKTIDKQLSQQDLKYSYKFIFEDGKAGTDNSPSTAARKFIDVDGVRFLISASSGETLQIGPIAQKNSTLLFAVFSSHKDVKHLGEFVFRTFIDVEQGMKLLSDIIRSEGTVPVALLTEDHAFTQGIKGLLENYLEGELAVVQDYPENETDLRTILHKARNTGAKAYYLNCAHPKTCAIITNQARQLGIKDPLYSYLHIDNPEYLQAADKKC